MKTLLIFLSFLFTVGGWNSANAATAQDPARTPKNSRQVDPVNTVDGSTGKYKKDHKITTGKNFATHKRHIKTAKPHKDSGKEKSNNTPGEKKG